MRISDWSSDVCSSDLIVGPSAGTREQVLLNFYVAGPFAWSGGETGHVGNEAAIVAQEQCRSQADRTSVVQGKSVYVRVALGGRRIVNRKHHTKSMSNYIHL